MKRFFLIFSLIFSNYFGIVFPVYAEDQSDNSNKERENTVIVAGAIEISENIWIPGYWENGVWNPIVVPQSGSWGDITGIIISEGNLYITGSCQRSDNSQNGGYWLNGKWFPGDTDSPQIRMISLWNLEIHPTGIFYAGECFDKKTDKPVPGYYKDKKWIPLPELVSGKGGLVSSILVSGNDIYVGGLCYNEEGEEIPGYWENGKWHSLPVPNTGGFACVYGIHKEENLYLWGTISDETGNYIPCYWTNGERIDLISSDSSDGKYGYPQSFSIFTGEIYIAGSKENELGAMAPGFWKNGQWIKLPALDDSKNSEAYSQVIIEGDFYTAGYCSNEEGLYVAGYWKNGVWTPMNQPEFSKNSMALSIYVIGSSD